MVGMSFYLGVNIICYTLGELYLASVIFWNILTLVYVVHFCAIMSVGIVDIMIITYYLKSKFNEISDDLMNSIHFSQVEKVK